MADVLYQSIREGVNEKLSEQADGTYVSNYATAPKVALPTDILYQVLREGVNKKLALQPDGTYAEVIQIIGGASGFFVPVIRFTGNATGGTNQTFTDVNLGRYALAEDIQLFVRGTTPIRLYGNLAAGATTDFTLSGTTITVAYNLPANASLFIDSKFVATVGVETFYILSELGDVINAENSDRVVTQASPTGELMNQE